MPPGGDFGEEVEGREIGGRKGMRIMVLIWILVEDVRLPLSPTLGWDEMAVSALDTFSTDSGWVYQNWA